MKVGKSKSCENSISQKTSTTLHFMYMIIPHNVTALTWTELWAGLRITLVITLNQHQITNEGLLLLKFPYIELNTFVWI